MGSYRKIDMRIVGGRIRKARNGHGLTQAKAAEKVDVSAQYWSLMESGKNRASVDVYLQIATLFGMTLDDLFYDDATINRLHRAFSSEGILAGCTTKEKAIISETVHLLVRTLERYR